MNENSIRRVHLVFKAHLDIGFTDLAAEVTNQYLTRFIPRALAVAEELRGSDTPFTWITGSWMIQKFLDEASREERLRMEKAIRAGEIGWHALPFTLHSEAAGREVFLAALDFSEQLDRRFGKTTIAAKMTDVPGHTRALIPILAKRGVRFFHIGINEASHPLELPDLFRWRHPGGEEILVNYQFGYGNMTHLPGSEDVLIFHHRHDNMGPPAPEEVKAAYARCRERFPRAVVRAGDLCSYAASLEAGREDLPVVEGEMGDGWIHGIGSDPLKVSRYRALVRSAEGWRKEGRGSGGEVLGFLKRLSLIPEHTWGMDVKTYLPDFFHYTKEALAEAKQRDVIDKECQVEGFNRFVAPPLGIEKKKDAPHERSYRLVEESWAEQRAYIDEAVRSLPAELRAEAEAALAEAAPRWPDLPPQAAEPVPPPEEYGPWRFRFDRESGALSFLSFGDSPNLVVPGGALGGFTYQTFSQKEYDAFYRRYLIFRRDTCWWSYQDFTKPGIGEVEGLAARTFLPGAAAFHVLPGEEELAVAVFTRMPREASETYGAPRKLAATYRFRRDSPRLALSFHWKEKEALRLPEASWLRFDLPPGNPRAWRLQKMGEPVSPFEVLPYGNRALHAADSLSYRPGRGDGGLPFSMETLDAPLISPGRPRILEYDQSAPRLEEGFFFNLHNNLWGTNFPMWYDEDGLFRFRLKWEIR